MSQTTMIADDLSLPAPESGWVERLPDGAVSIESDGNHWVLRASRPLQARFEQLLERRKSSQLSVEEAVEYDAICDLDHLLSGFNRLARRIQ